jgi:hypothetical protein
MTGNLPVPSHRQALRAWLLAFPLKGFSKSLLQETRCDAVRQSRGRASPATHATLVMMV